MFCEDQEYIYFKSIHDNVTLDSFKEKIKSLEINKEPSEFNEIIDIFIKKMKMDYIESSELLINSDNRQSYTYPISLILMSCIDVLAKYYTGNITIRKSSNSYKKFLKQNFLFKSVKTRDIYEKFRCAITHQNSTSILIGFEGEDYFEILKSKKIKVNLEKLKDKINEIIGDYELKLKEGDTALKEKFLSVLKEIYK